MSFTSTIFIIVFFPICFFCILLSNAKYRNLIYLLASLVFYFWCGLQFLILLLISAFVAYIVGRGIELVSSVDAKRITLILGILYGVGNLFYYKYFYDMVSFLIKIPGLGRIANIFERDSALLPLGISFYTFSILSYILDVYWEKCEVQHNPIDLLLYVMFYPRVIQGPIMRYSDFEQQMKAPQVCIRNMDAGLQRFAIGMFKKLLIADQLIRLVDYSFSGITSVGTIPAWLGIIAYLFQLYFDFSGYSDMAIGLGLLFGFVIPENFDHPYMSKTVSEYWRRWHITLGAWFRDYLYMPLCRCFLEKRLFSGRYQMLYIDLMALFITWLLDGIWHGSGFKFFVYGLWWVAFIFIERISDYCKKLIRKRKKLPKKPESLKEKVGKHIMTILAILLGQVIFRADSLKTSAEYITRMFRWDTRDGWLFLAKLNNSTVLALIMGSIFIFPVWAFIKKHVFERNMAMQVVYRGILIVVFLVSFLYSIGAGYAPFLYQVF